jgi:hypothetical protein
MQKDPDHPSGPLVIPQTLSLASTPSLTCSQVGLRFQDLGFGNRSSDIAWHLLWKQMPGFHFQ